MWQHSTKKPQAIPSILTMILKVLVPNPVYLPGHEKASPRVSPF